MHRCLALVVTLYGLSSLHCAESTPPDPTVEPGQPGENDRSGNPGPVGSCAALDEATCSATPACEAIAGTRYDVARACVFARAAVGCSERGACGDEGIAFAIDPAGQRWWFPTTCIPAGWQRVDAPSAEDRAALSWGACD